MSATVSARIVDLAQSGFPAIQAGATVSKSILKLIAVGDATGIVLPDEVLTRMGVRCGDSLLLTETAEGFGLTARHGDVQNQIELADDLMRENHAVLRRLSQ